MGPYALSCQTTKMSLNYYSQYETNSFYINVEQKKREKNEDDQDSREEKKRRQKETFIIQIMDPRCKITFFIYFCFLGCLMVEINQNDSLTQECRYGVDYKLQDLMGSLREPVGLSQFQFLMMTQYRYITNITLALNRQSTSFHPTFRHSLYLTTFYVYFIDISPSFHRSVIFIDISSL